jgi:hypothetical protein
MALIFYKRTPNLCRPSMFLPTLDRATHKLAAVGQPQYATKIQMSKETLTRLRSLRKHKTQTRVLT